MRTLLSRALIALVTMSGGVTAAAAENVTKDEIRIGQTLPYSGPLSGFGTIGRAEQAYFDKINSEGGINGRKIKFITLDDAFSPPKTVEQTRRLVEQEDVLLIFGSLGTATSSAVHRYLNDRKVPQLFIASGASKWADPKNFPWTMAGMASYQSEGVIYGKYVLQRRPDAKIAILSQNDDFGRDYVAGFKRALGEQADAMIVAEAKYETTAPTIASQIATLKSSGANVLFGVTLGKFSSQLIRGVAEAGWRPDVFFVPTSAAPLSILEPAGLENAKGLMTSAYQKYVDDPQWADDGDVREYREFMKQYLPSADPNNSTYSFGYIQAALLTHVLRQCGDDFSRENVRRQASSLQNLELPLLLPGVTVTTSSDDYLLFQQLRLQRFDGKSWAGFGELLDDK